MKRLAIIGAGNMGAALCRGLMETMPDLRFVLSDRHEERLGQFPGIERTKNPADAVAGSDCVLIAVKPQSFAALCEELGESLSKALVLSIMAGKTITTIAQATGSQRIVRAMPNLGVKTGRGMTAWIASEKATKQDAAFAAQIFRSVGKEIRVADEAMIDRFTAIAGCGPAYFFRLCSALEEQAKAQGFSEEDARTLAEETFIGSALLLDTGGKTAAEWTAAVASKGGSTEAALRHFQEKGFDELFGGAIEEAHRRAKELNG